MRNILLELGYANGCVWSCVLVEAIGLWLVHRAADLSLIPGISWTSRPLSYNVVIGFSSSTCHPAISVVPVRFDAVVLSPVLNSSQIDGIRIISGNCSLLRFHFELALSLHSPEMQY